MQHQIFPPPAQRCRKSLRAVKTRPAASYGKSGLLVPPALVPPTQQETSIPAFVALIAEHSQPFSKRPAKPFAIVLLHRQSLRTSSRRSLPFVDLRRHVDA